MPEPTPADRALRAVADSVTDSRARLPEDATDPSIPVAATVVLLRDGDAGLEVLVIERPDRGSFAGAWVFPGGKLEDGDRAGADEAEDDVARRAGVRETHEETGLVIDPAVLETLSVWDPPPGLALRIRTWFFVAPAAEGEITLSPGEAVAAEWARPAELLERHGRGELTLYPPTWVTLHGLAAHADAASVLGSARLAGVQRFETVARRGAEGPLLVWHGDDDWDPDAAASGSRHRLEIGALPWRYSRTQGDGLTAG
ncbi:NUDIX hydrolase [Microbacterium kyungheense]|uniref:8-oxo-dGTP pyrophosphatase MutT (NUDIX family) n=1 Tax=Microbacterium kyungheense TaxID=1263636 RepID=A0A543FL80_9MICO|nr:NUDIX domain-containing protein [Microbacterium kyungheense]TQM34595.1 8-oxo-dGTP pyrophosphatase MutT (NUDIX family) [Microbacterium kyungheense]